jgi:hypothetical protein
MMVELLLTRHLRDLMKAKIIAIRLFKREGDINKILSQSGNISDPCFAGKSNHGFGGVNGYFSDR